MKILLISNLYPPISRGGSEQVAFRVAQELSARGNHVSVLSTCSFGSVKDLRPHRTQKAGCEVFRFFPFNLYHLLDSSGVPFLFRIPWHLIDLWNPQSKRALERVLDEVDPDVVITHNLKGLGYSVLSAIHSRGLPHIHVLHDVQLSVPSGILLFGQESSGLLGTPLRAWYEGRMIRLFDATDTVVSPSQFLMDFYSKRGFFKNSRKIVLPNPAPQIQPIQARCHDSDTLHLFFVGQLVPHKGILTLIDALDLVSIPFHLHIVGEGPLQEYVSNYARLDARVTYHGKVTLQHLMELLSLCQASIVPSLCYENSPMVIYESFAVGVPVLGARIGGIPELVREGQNGLLFTPGDTKDIARAIERMYMERDAFASRAAAIQEGIRPYELRRYVDVLEGYIRETIAENGVRSGYRLMIQ